MSLSAVDQARLAVIEQYEALIVLACAHLPHDSADMQKRAARAILAQGPSPEAVALAWPDRRPETPTKPRVGQLSVDARAEDS